MTSRYLPVKTRAALAQQTSCVLCADEGAFERDHIVPVGLGGGNEPDNLRRLCLHHHREKTRRDVKMIAKANRIAKKLAGTWRPKRKRIPSRGFSKEWRHKMNGSVERR